MALQLDTLNGGKRDPAKGEGVPIGALVVGPDHSWFAKRGDGETREGVGGFRRFGGGYWVNNLSFKDSTDLFCGSLKKTVRSESWWRISVPEILDEWGSGGVDIRQAGNLLSILFERMSSMLVHLIRATSSDADTAESEWRNLCSSASLATGLYCLFERDLESRIPHETEMVEHFDKTRQVGFGFRRFDAQPSDVILDFRMPLFSHARNILSHKVPQASVWKRAKRDESVSVSEFLAEIARDGRPALVRALLSPHDEKEREWVSAFIDQGMGERSRFLIDEIDLISGVPMEVDSALIGGGWTSPFMADILDLVSAYCGGDSGAALSWSAGIVAENLLAAPYRTGRNRNHHASGDAIWMAARDRILMAPLVEAAETSGGRVISARTGRVRVAAPPVPEVVSAIVWAAWGAGAHLDFGTASRLRASGVCQDPPIERGSFGGKDADYIFAAACHAGDRGVLWKFDGIPALRPEEKSRVLKGLSLLP